MWIMYDMIVCGMAWGRICVHTDSQYDIGHTVNILLILFANDDVFFLFHQKDDKMLRENPSSAVQ